MSTFPNYMYLVHYVNVSVHKDFYTPVLKIEGILYLVGLCLYMQQT